jgi:hypothetical protein
MPESAADRLYVVNLCIPPYRYGASLLLNTLVNEAVDFMSIRTEYVVLGAGEVGVYLARKERIFRHVGSPRVFFEGQNEEPCDSDYDAKGREVGRDLEDAGIFAERKDGSCRSQHLHVALLQENSHMSAIFVLFNCA